MFGLTLKSQLIEIHNFLFMTCLLGLEALIIQVEFLSCPVTKIVWQYILSVSGISKPVLSCDDDFSWAKKYLQKKCFSSILHRLAWIAYIYYAKKERNDRFHSNKFTPIRIVAKNIMSIVSIRLSNAKIAPAIL